LKNINNNPQTTLRQLALDLKNYCNKTVSQDTIRKVLNTHKYSSHVARKNPMLSAINIDRRLRFSIANANRPAEYWNDIMTKEFFLYILKKELTKSVIDFGLICRQISFRKSFIKATTPSTNRGFEGTGCCITTAK